MVPTKNDTTTINGKKICWNYRKGRCRFGHKCAFAHDSDLQKTDEELEKERENSIKESLICQSNNTPDKVTQNVGDDVKSKKKRPGLTQGLTPGKKVMKMFNKQQNKPLC